ncbi:hypothetical protein COU58_01620 [Candidatus Pacearchaeota archaeon CG10_big_fil_rev_8_21_14_0_10_32_42]|nr:MAG: hypothetical protein COU58_01620 [Candidatus Pacearchaeota archaeon CG10_big_fil_rev_8_21_14_0_10_32_42]
MGLFSKKEQNRDLIIPSLPDLPEIPNQFPIDEDFENSFHELPSFPASNTGDIFSRESIKNAISGNDEPEELEITRKEFIPKPQFRTPSKFMKETNAPKSAVPSLLISREREMPLKETGPVFIRIDKFEEALKIFKETKEKINDIEKLLDETKELKEKEEGELSTWESEIQGMKKQIEKVDRDIFSKI